ncbi:centrosomal protein of 63 kDa-like [Lineus longissimus]|uniref:centrosomal protein of 63 kDa-like n=1 Tax=Lineus longissimus TaxID=88925 RepID=UPI00315CCB70
MDRGFNSIWGDLQTSNRFPWNGQLMSTCEAELQELMKQIDIMVQNKKLEWERDLQGLEAKLEMREKETMMQRATIEQKHREIGQLRQQVDGMERAQREMVSEYEHQLTQCKNELVNIKKDYEKLQKKHSKNSKEAQKEKNKTSTELQDSFTEIQRLQSKVEEYRHKAKDWDLQRRNYEKQIESLDSQKRTYAEKCDLIQQQAVGFQSQLDKRRQILDNTEYNLKTQIAQLEGQLERAKDTLQAQESQIEKLKSSLDDTVMVQRRVLDEKDFVEKELRESKKIIINLEDDVARQKVEIQKKDDILKMVEDDQHHRAQEFNNMEQVLMEKEEIIQSFEMHDRKEHSEYIGQLQDEVKQVKSDIKAYKKNERRLNEEISRLQNKIRQSQEDYADLQEKFKSKAEEMSLIDGVEIKKLNSEVTKLKEQLSMSEAARASEVAGLRLEMSNQAAELHKRTIAMAGLGEKVTLGERQMREENEKFERRAAELQVANAQLEALRLENRHLRQTALKQIQSNADVMEAEAHLKELQNAYSLSVSKLEQEKRDLYQQMDSLQDELHLMEQSHRQKQQIAREETDRSVHDLRENDERRYKELQREHNQKLEAMREQLEETARRYESEIQGLQREKQKLQQDITHKEDSFKRMVGQNSVMSSFVGDIDSIVNSPNRSNRSHMVTPRLRQSGAAIDAQNSKSADQLEQRQSKSGHVRFSPDENLYSLNAQDGASDQNTLAVDGTRPKVYSSDSNLNPTINLNGNHSEERSLYSPFENVENTERAYGGRSSSPIVIGKSPSTKVEGPSVHFDESPLKRVSPKDWLPQESNLVHGQNDGKIKQGGSRNGSRNASPRPPPDAGISRRSPMLEQSRLAASHNEPDSRSLSMLGLDAGGLEHRFSLSDHSDTERPSSRASVSTRFLQEEQERAKELEKLIDSHIEELKQETEKTIKKYTR